MFKASSFKLQLYETCPQQYKYVYIDKIADEYKTPKPYLTMGANVHNALHDFFGKYSLKDRTWQKLEYVLRKRWKENRNGFVGPEDERTWGLKALDMLQLYFKNADVQATPVMLEDYYSYDINDRLSVIGRIDRVDETENGLHVIDYKTGVFHEEDVNETQLLLYSLIIAKKTGLKIAKASFLYLPSYTWYSVEPQEDDYDYIIEQLRLKVEKIENDASFLPRVNKYCRNCDFMEICPAQEEAEIFIKKMEDEKKIN